MDVDNNPKSENAGHVDPKLEGRRTALKSIGGLMGLGIATSFAVGGRVAAQQEASGLSNRSFSQKEMQGTPWVAPKLGNFNLRDPWENRLAAMKTTNNLIGEKTYVPMISRALLGPQGTAGAPLYGHVGLWTWQLQEVNPEEFPDAPEGSFVQRALFTGAILNPFTYERVETVHNHVLDKEVEVQDSLFAESYLFYPRGGATSVDRPEFMDDDPELLKALRPFVRFGDDVTMFVDGIFHNDGPHQPRMDTSAWTMPWESLNNPDEHLATTDYNFAGLMRAWERPWIGFEKGDEEQILWNVKGRKVHRVEDIPDIAIKNLVERYPDRV